MSEPHVDVPQGVATASASGGVSGRNMERQMLQNKCSSSDIASTGGMSFGMTIPLRSRMVVKEQET